MAKRGFFAELNYQAQQAEKRRLQQESAAARAHRAAVREAEAANRAAERSRVAVQRANASELAAADREAKRLHLEARLKEVDALNAELATKYGDIDRLLEATLEVDDHVDLEALKVSPEYLEFIPGNLADPLPPVVRPTLPRRPEYRDPEPPKGIAGAIGRKKKHAEAVTAARRDHEQAVRRWDAEVEKRRNQYQWALTKREEAEAVRRNELTDLQRRHQQECAMREEDARQINEGLDRLINDLAFDVPAAISEYVSIVLSNSIYPESFQVEHTHLFDLATRELSLTVLVPDPSLLPSVKEYRYVKATDEITASQLSVKAQKDRYTTAVHQTAVRTLHEIFEADRAGRIHSIALTVGVNRYSPATGLPEMVPLVQVAAGRETFVQFDLSQVVPQETLRHLGAALSKNPFGLIPADIGPGVRRQGI